VNRPTIRGMQVSRKPPKTGSKAMAIYTKSREPSGLDDLLYITICPQTSVTALPETPL